MSSGVLVLVIVGPFVVVAALMLQGWVSHRRQREQLDTVGRAAVGRVVEVGTSDDGIGGVSYLVKVNYDHDEADVTVSVPIAQRDRQRYRTGQRIGLTYVPGQPKSVRLDPPERTPSTR